MNLYGSGEKSLVRTDLYQRLLVGERESKEAAIRYVQETEAVEPRFNREERTDLSIDQNPIRRKLRYPGVIGVSRGVVEELTIRCEITVIEDERNLVFARGKMKRIFYLVADEKHAE